MTELRNNITWSEAFDAWELDARRRGLFPCPCGNRTRTNAECCRTGFYDASYPAEEEKS